MPIAAADLLSNTTLHPLFRNTPDNETFSDLNQTPNWSSTDSDETMSVAWGDVDNDGDLDLVVGNDGPNKVYLNEGGVLIATPAWSSTDSDETMSVAWGDVDNDGDLDLAVGNDGPNKVYLNEGGVLPSASVWSSTDSARTMSVAWGDVDNDGDPDLTVGNNGPNKVYLNDTFTSAPAGQAVFIDIDASQTVGQQLGLSNFFARPTIHQDGLMTIPYTIFTPHGQSVRTIRAIYSLNGGGAWRSAIEKPPAQSEISDLDSSHHIFLPLLRVDRTDLRSLTRTDGLYVWDVHASDFFGQSDNVIFRLEAHLNCVNSCQRTYVATQTFPFRVRGTQVRVRNENDQPTRGATIYRLPKGQTIGAMPVRGFNERVLRTDAQGYLQGSGPLVVGDRLIALSPITATEKYAVYQTNANPIRSGLDLTEATVDQFGVQELSVSADYPLILFNLDVSLEWDARADQLYLGQLTRDLERTSVLLYDWTNGHAALGDITVYQAKAQWEEADIRIHATNRLRPHATIGGIVSNLFLDTITIPAEDDATTTATYLYAPGHVEMGAVWNRYGEPGDQLSEDWARTLAHELGHYLFFLHDNYVGLDNDNRVVRVKSCLGVMQNPYGETNSEFHPQTDWLPNCEETFSHRKLGRHDWATIKAHYPWLHEPSVPTFSLTKSDGQRYLASSSARAFLFQGDQLIDLGAPRNDRVEARDAHPGDTLCVYDLAAKDPDGLITPLTRCVTIQTGDEELSLEMPPGGWQPELIITPRAPRP
ncbi:VCBS repeat-containing protein [Chloroflexi bacterium TSY]|nr:VCBS repeat-containing protein [Chloroflexi bacterium TSY]